MGSPRDGIDTALSGVAINRIVYVGSDGDIYAIHPDGTNRVRLTTDGGNNSPQWSPTTGRIAFLHATKATTNDDCRRVEVMNSDGTQRRVVLDPLPAFSPPTQCALLANVRWSADTCTLYFQVAPGPVGMHPVRSQPLCGGTSSEASFCHFFDVRGDGSFACEYYNNGAGRYYLAIGALDDPNRLIVEQPGGPVAWSPDGTRIAIVRSGELDVVSEAGELRDRLQPSASPSGPPSTRGYYDTSVDWSPDQQGLIYESGTELWITSVSSGESQFLTTGSQPDWSP